MTTYSYVAVDAASNRITRDGITAEALDVHYANLVVSGYHVTVTDDSTGLTLTNEQVCVVQTNVQRAKYGRGPLAVA